MLKRRIFGALLLGLVLALLLAWSSAELGSRTLAATVCADGYPSIQNAIVAAGEGGIVHIPAGIYTETLLVTTTTTLQGGWDDGCVTRVTTDPAATVIDGDGGGPVISITLGAPMLESLTLTGGRSQRGAGLYVRDGSATLSATVVSGNVATTTVEQGTYGAGVYVENSAITMTASVIALNVAEAYPGQTTRGAGVYLDYQSRAVLVATRILSNTGPKSASVRGGGMFVGGGALVEFAGSENLIFNNAASYGGGIYTYGSSRLSGGQVVSNYASVGGGIAAFQGEGGSISNMIVVSNSGRSEASGILVDRARSELANNTIVGNGGSAGSGVEIRSVGSVPVTLTNNIIVGHDVGILNNHQTISPTLITNNVWDNGVNYQGVMTGTTDWHEDPLFVDAMGGDYHLAAGSPLIDAGTTIPWLHDDFDGDFRPDNCHYDIGADEYVTGFTCYAAYLPIVLR